MLDFVNLLDWTKLLYLVMCNGDETRPDLKLDQTPILLRKDQSSFRNPKNWSHDSTKQHHFANYK